ncbi:MAG TPA: ParB/RepB/Spo0J family partition protein [Gemmatimonadaceae bacterium]|nr:ParB/RepB/Spo0J family partition protein [Gemmatimonadaceae bacterium]
MPPERSPRRLGRGLDALFGAQSPAKGDTPEESALREIAIDQVRSNPFQPRKSFKAAELVELQESLQASGLLQPITVRPAPKGGTGYELIAGERRLRAAANLGWPTIPAVIKDLSDKEILTLALVENLQRSDLNAVEEAEGYEQLIRDFGYTQQTVATMVGKDRSTVANVLRILQLPAGVRRMLQEGDLTAGQARPLLGLGDSARISTLAKEILDKGLSARDVESRVRESGPEHKGRKQGRPKKVDTRPAEVRSLEQDLRKRLQTDVTISLRSGNRGTIEVAFYSPEDLDRVVELMGLTNNPQ